MKKHNTLQTFSDQFWRTVKFTKIVSVLIAAIYITTAAPLNVRAAITGKVAGVITAEATSEPLANVTVTILGTSSIATTNDAGYYVMTNIAPGDYDVKAELTGYGPKTVEGATVLAGLTTTLNFSLKTSEVVTLEGSR